MAKRKKVGADDIVSKFMTATLEEGRFPVSVYRFCKENRIDETEFYEHFGSLESVKKAVWSSFYDQTIGLLNKNKEYAEFDRKDKLLSFYYTFFELLALNRSYVLFAIGEGMPPVKTMPQLMDFRKKFKSMLKSMVEAGNSEKTTKISQLNPHLISEGAWLQMVFLLRFWVRDDSPGFERTDIAIEKSVNTVFEIFDNTPIDSIVDLGKFLFHGQAAS